MFDQAVQLVRPDSSNSHIQKWRTCLIGGCQFSDGYQESAFDKALAEHEDIDDAVGSEEPTERDHGVDLEQPLLIKIDSSDNHQK
ncbi:hypothetical protein OROGR_027833 [Orobanche gracilis]